MAKYWLVFRLAAQEIFEYRFDFFVHGLKYTLMVLMMSFVWLAVGRANPNLPLTNTETVSYFFFAAMLYSLSNFHTNYIEDDIRLGQLSKFLIRPIQAYTYYLVFELAPSAIETAVKLVVMWPLLIALGFGFTTEPLRLGLFLLFLPLIYIFSFSQFGIISGLAFWISEAWAIRWSALIVFRFLAGIFIPISFLPILAQKIFFWLPYQHLAYTPISLIQGKLPLETAVLSLGILAMWTVIMGYLRWALWQQGYRQYESAGS